MTNTPIIECVPNISEGRDRAIIDQVAQAAAKVAGVQLLDIDPGQATNRTVITFVGSPQAVIEGALALIKRASELIDMSHHSGEHPRMGAVDVCPLIPISGVTMEEVAGYAHELGRRVGDELGLTGYFYESAASSPERMNLATVRSGEYEGLENKLEDPNWAPDFGPARFNASFGCMAIGARDFLVAYNVNLNTTSVRRANAVAFDIREKGRVKREGHPIKGPIIRDAKGEPLRVPGQCKSVKAIGWFIEEYGLAQISMNLTNIKDTNLHEAFEACRNSARARGLRVTGSELVGLVPKAVMIEAGKHYLRLQERSLGIPDREIIKIAVKSMGLDELGAFDIDQKVIEYRMAASQDRQPLLGMTLRDFAYEGASESPAPGGGSISAYVGALAASMATMVANLSAHKRGWDDRWETFSDYATVGQSLTDRLLDLVDADTHAFNAIIAAVRMPKESDEDKARRAQAIHDATVHAIEVPYQIAQTAMEVFDLADAMVRDGNPNSVSDAGVAALCARAAVHGSVMNVRINCADLNDASLITKYTDSAIQMLKEADERESAISAGVYKVID